MTTPIDYTPEPLTTIQDAAVYALALVEAWHGREVRLHFNSFEMLVTRGTLASEIVNAYYATPPMREAREVAVLDEEWVCEPVGPIEEAAPAGAIEYIAEPSITIEQAARAAVRLSRANYVGVYLRYGDFTMLVTMSRNVDEVVNAYAKSPYAAPAVFQPVASLPQTRMTPDEQVHLRMVAAKATKGQWNASGPLSPMECGVAGGTDATVVIVTDNPGEDPFGPDAETVTEICNCGPYGDAEAAANQAYIVAAHPAAMLRALDTIAALEEEVRKYKGDAAVHERLRLTSYYEGVQRGIENERERRRWWKRLLPKKQRDD